MIALSALESAFYTVSGVLWLFLLTFLIEGMEPLNRKSWLILSGIIILCFLAVLFCGYSVWLVWNG